MYSWILFFSQDSGFDAHQSAASLAPLSAHAQGAGHEMKPSINCQELSCLDLYFFPHQLIIPAGYLMTGRAYMLRALTLFFPFSRHLRTCFTLCKYWAVADFLAAFTVFICMWDTKVFVVVLNLGHAAFWQCSPLVLIIPPDHIHQTRRKFWCHCFRSWWCGLVSQCLAHSRHRAGCHSFILDEDSQCPVDVVHFQGFHYPGVAVGWWSFCSWSAWSCSLGWQLTSS